MHTRSGPAPALVDRQRERETLDGLIEGTVSRSSTGCSPTSIQRWRG
jgi:hypothetical protein